jgi:hypothetical protein
MVLLSACLLLTFARLNDQTRPEVLGSWSSSKYEATNNRCYVRIYKHTRRKSQFDYEVHQVYDAQVEDLLAHAEMKNGKKFGMIYDESYKGARWLSSGDASWEAAITYMDELMADPRKQ